MSESPASTRAAVESRSSSSLVGLPALEAALARGLAAEWTSLANEDSQSSLFQSLGWCLAWYRSYDEQFEPHVLLVKAAGRLVGLVPLAVDRRTRELTFASGRMADYRDVVASPDHRQQVVAELLRYFATLGSRGPLQIGWLDPSSDTSGLVIEECERMGFRYVIRHQPCWRWRPPAPEKPSALKFLKWYRRHGDVEFKLVSTPEEWQRFRDIYYRQHSLRQLQAGRPAAFDDPRRTTFYDALFRSSDVRTHVSGFWVNGALVAGHFGYVWRDMLLLGPPSIRLEDEQRSPAVVLLAWIIQSAAQWGLKGFDLTIGDSAFKERLGNYCVTLTAIDVYRSRPDYYRQAVRSGSVRAAKKLIIASKGPEAWDRNIKSVADRLRHKRARFRELGVRRSLVIGIRAALSKVYEQRIGLVYSISRHELRPAKGQLSERDTLSIHANCPEDLLLWRGSSVDTASSIAAVARSYSRARQLGRTLYTVLLNEELAGWGFSYVPASEARLTETPGATLSFPPGSVSLYDFHVIPAFRGRRLYQVLLSHILADAFDSGAERAFITVLASNRASRAAIERVGFQLMARNRYRRTLGRESLESLD